MGGSGIRSVGRSGSERWGANGNLEACLPFLVFEFKKGFAGPVHPQPDPGVAYGRSETDRRNRLISAILIRYWPEYLSRIFSTSMASCPDYPGY
jgi:hypothetical protein